MFVFVLKISTSKEATHGAGKWSVVVFKPTLSLSQIDTTIVSSYAM